MKKLARKQAFRIAARVGVVALMLAGAPCAAVAENQTQGIISGTITDSQNGVVANAKVRLQAGPPYQATQTLSGNDGTYHFYNLPNGAYSITVTKEGWTPETVTDIILGKGVITARVDVQLLQPSFTSAKTIGKVVTSATRSTFNTTPVSYVNMTSRLFLSQGQTSVSHIFDETPGVVADTLGAYNVANPFAGHFVTVRDGLTYETQQTLDGHPLANGQFGAVRTQWFNTSVFDDVELVKGPGYAPTTIVGAINGGINYRTKEPTSYPYTEIDLATDNEGSFPYSLTTTGTTANKKLGYALVYAADFEGGPPLPKNTYNVVYQTNVNGLYNATSPFGAFGLYNGTCCVILSEPAVSQPVVPTRQGGYSYNELAKLLYHFSDATSLELSYYGIQGSVSHAAADTLVQPGMFEPGSSYAGSLPGNIPLLLNVVGNEAGYTWTYRPSFTTEFRTRVKDDTVLARWYSIHQNSHTTLYGDYINPERLWGTIQLCPPGMISIFMDGLCGPIGQPVSNETTPANTYTFNGQAVNLSNSAQYSDEEGVDTMGGATVEWDHPVGNNLYTLSVDRDKNAAWDAFYYQFGYDASTGLLSRPVFFFDVPPGASQTATSYMLRALLNPSEKTTVTLANYYEVFNLHSLQSTQANFTTQPNYSSNIFRTDITYHDDWRAGFTYRPNINTSIRLALGSSITQPFLWVLNNPGSAFPSFVSGPPAIYSLSIHNPGLVPETAFGYNLGADMRLGSDGFTVSSTDVYLTNLKNQFYTLNQQHGFYTDNIHGYLPSYITEPSNIADARYYGVEETLTHAPPYGLGFQLSGALMRGYAYNLPPNFYNSGPIGCGAPCQGNYQTANTTTIAYQNWDGALSLGTFTTGPAPYSKGYAEVNYRSRSDWRFAFGETYHGPNNPELGTPFFVARASISKDINPGTTMQVTIDNLFNALSFPYTLQGSGIFAPLQPNAMGYNPITGVFGPAVPSVAQANGLGQRIIRLWIHKEFGRPRAALP